MTDDAAAAGRVPVSPPAELGGFRFAGLVDGFDGDRPRPWPGRSWITDDAERERILGYLRGGAVVLSTDVTTLDILDRSRGRVVPLSSYTDGSWIWSEAVTYHLATHRLAPQPELLAHIVAHGYRCPPVPEERRLAARAAYLERTELEAAARAAHQRDQDRDRQRESTPFTLVRGELSNEPPTVRADDDLVDAMIDGGYDRFSEATQTELVAAGWLPGRNAAARVDPWLDAFGAREESGRRHEVFPAARQVLHEFGLLDLDLFGTGEVEERHPVRFYPMDVWIDPLDHLRFSRSLGQRVFPVAGTEPGGGVLLVDESGRIFLLNDDGGFFLGDTIDAALELLVHGRTPARVVGGRWERG